MATLTILGHDVDVGDEFLRLSPEDQQKFVNELATHLPQQPGILEQATTPITSYFPTQREMAKEGLQLTERGIGQIAGEGDYSRPEVGPFPVENKRELEVARGVGNTVIGALGYVSSPLSAGYRTLLGQPIQNITGIPREYTETVAGLATPGIGFVPGRVLRRVPPRPITAPNRMNGVTLSEGQATRDLPQIQFEQAAARGQLGAPAQRQAQQFIDQQRSELAAARGDIADTLGANVETPQEAGAAVQASLQRAAQSARATTQAAYETARGLPGEIHAGAFEGMPQRIKGELTLGDSPVIVDERLTPYASHMLADLERNVGNLRIPNRADPFGAPSAENITGVSLAGVEQWRKRLSSFRRDAFNSGNQADARAAQRVLDSFDDQIDRAVNSGLFNGDPRAVQAWNDARASYADYRQTFTAQKGDPVGRVIERIVGRADRNNPAAIPNDVADYIYGAAGTNPNSLNNAVVQRLRQVFGEQSPEWAAIKQGLFSRLVDAGPGMTPFGPGRVAQRLNQFLNKDGVEMSRLLFTPAERQMLQGYADVLRHLEIPQAGANWSNTAAFAGQGFRPSLSSQVAEEVAGSLAPLVLGRLGHVPVIGPMVGRGVQAIVGAPQQARDAARVAQQMPIIANVVRQQIRAMRTYELSPNAVNAARVALTTRNLATNFNDLGLPLPPSLTGGGEQQQQTAQQ